MSKLYNYSGYMNKEKNIKYIIDMLNSKGISENSTILRYDF